MAEQKASSMDTTGLIQGIVKDLEKLLGQQFQMFKNEVMEELKQAKNAGLSIGAGAGLTALAGILGVQMVVHLLHEATGLPLWLCFGLVGGGAAAAGTLLIQSGVKEVADVQLFPPPQTAQAIKRGVAELAR